MRAFKFGYSCVKVKQVSPPRYRQPDVRIFKAFTSKCMEVLNVNNGSNGTGKDTSPGILRIGRIHGDTVRLSSEAGSSDVHDVDGRWNGTRFTGCSSVAAMRER